MTTKNCTKGCDNADKNLCVHQRFPEGDCDCECHKSPKEKGRDGSGDVHGRCR